MISSQVAAAVAVAVLLDGVVLPSAAPATIVDGRVVAPIALVAKFADRVVTLPDGGMTASRGDHACDARAVRGMVALAALARCLGARVTFDGHAKTIALTFGPASGVRTHAPYNPAAPQVAPTTIFTPEPPSPTPRAVATGVPRPRRTAIPAIPSFPLAPFTGSRPRSL